MKIKYWILLLGSVAITGIIVGYLASKMASIKGTYRKDESKLFSFEVTSKDSINSTLKDSIHSTGAGSLLSAWAEERGTLAGLQGVYVLVESPSLQANRYGLTKEELQSDTESVLRQNGISVLSFQQMVRTPRNPWLYVQVIPAINQEKHIAGIAVTLQLIQSTLLQREPPIVCRSISWDKTAAAWIVGLNNLKEVRKVTKELVSMFINDYLAANQEMPGKEK